jgi:hypothetical protein
MSVSPVPAHPAPPAFSGQGRVRGHEAHPGRGTSPAGGTTLPEARATHQGDLLSADAPAGTDPMLWSVLTGEERSFFARARALGHVTYGPGAAPSTAGVPRGGRVDVRV